MSEHEHSHHHHHGHSHGTEDVSDTVLLWTVVANLGLSVFEFIAGVISGSVALMADALHNTNDAAALLIAFIARKVAKRGADSQFTFGYRRAELIGAMIQLTALLVVGVFLLYEAVLHILEPQPISGQWIILAAGVALVVDVVTAWLLWAMSKGSLNLKAAFLHNLTDAGASLAVLIGGAAIYFLGWTLVDPILSILIAGYILYMSFGMLKTTSRILMEGTPPDLSLDEIQHAVEGVEGVENMHHLHVWELDEKHRALEAHVVLNEQETTDGMERIKGEVKRLLKEQFSIHHTTLEFESAENACRSEAGKLLPVH